jgi:hypothetical protein
MGRSVFHISGEDIRLLEEQPGNLSNAGFIAHLRANGGRSSLFLNGQSNTDAILSRAPDAGKETPKLKFQSETAPDL